MLRLVYETRLPQGARKRNASYYLIYLFHQVRLITNVFCKRPGQNSITQNDATGWQTGSCIAGDNGWTGCSPGQHWCDTLAPALANIHASEYVFLHACMCVYLSCSCSSVSCSSSLSAWYLSHLSSLDPSYRDSSLSWSNLNYSRDSISRWLIQEPVTVASNTLDKLDIVLMVDWSRTSHSDQ